VSWKWEDESKFDGRGSWGLRRERSWERLKSSRIRQVRGWGQSVERSKCIGKIEGKDESENEKRLKDVGTWRVVTGEKRRKGTYRLGIGMFEEEGC
jgi:hypothetical protein